MWSFLPFLHTVPIHDLRNPPPICAVIVCTSTTPAVTMLSRRTQLLNATSPIPRSPALCRTHAYHSFRLDRACPACEAARNERVSFLEKAQTIRFDSWRWNVSYKMPRLGLDRWSEKAIQRAEADRTRLEESRRHEDRFGWNLKKLKRNGPAH